jgi:predicted nucleotidyltransferase component of viral defense system
MLAVNELRKVASRAGARDIGNVEIDVILTHLLQLFTESGISGHVAFKGGTMLRKMVFGPRGRLSTDLDFTCRTDIDVDDLMMLLLDALSKPYEGLTFDVKDKDWYLTDDGCAANPVCSHKDNAKGVNIKLQISTRERPILPVVAVPQIEQDYFKLLGFVPAAVPSLAFEEAIAEKIRAASQRSKIRDLHDLSEIAGRNLNRELIRSLATLKLWNNGGPRLDYGRFSERIKGGGDYDAGELANLLRKDQKPDLEGMIRRVLDGFRFLADLTEAERTLAADAERKRRKEADALIASLIAPPSSQEAGSSGQARQ